MKGTMTCKTSRRTEILGRECYSPGKAPGVRVFPNLHPSSSQRCSWMSHCYLKLSIRQIKTSFCFPDGCPLLGPPSLSVPIPLHQGLSYPLLTQSCILCGPLDEGVPIPSLQGTTCPADAPRRPASTSSRGGGLAATDRSMDQQHGCVLTTRPEGRRSVSLYLKKLSGDLLAH